MFSQVSVILSTRGDERGEGGVCMTKGACVGKRGGACMMKGRRACMVRGGACMAGETATAADSTHPTKMHSCLRCVQYLRTMS